ncbi:MAG: hypothetical protein ABEJ82_02990 [Haloplanus sp.]
MLAHEVPALVERYEAVAPGGLIAAVWYDGGEYDLVHVREDFEEAYSSEELEEKTKQLVVEGLSDSKRPESFRMYGEMNVAIRSFENAVVLHFPVDDFAGIALSFDTDAATSLDTLVAIGLDHFESLDDGQ